ncbi:hypothetical protein [Chitinimonas naiadis]
METTTVQVQGIMRSTEAVSNWRALAMAGLAGIAYALMFMLSGFIMARLGAWTGIVMLPATLLVLLIGYSAVGFLLMRQVQGESISIGDALLQATFTVHRLVGVALCLLLILLVGIIVAAIVLLLCRIPVLGPILFTVALPVLSLALGLLLVGLFYVGLPLAAPAIWEGNTTMQALAKLLGIIRQRLVSVLVAYVLLTLLLMLIGLLVGSVLGTGYGLVLGLSGMVGVPVGGGLMPQLMGHMSYGGGPAEFAGPGYDGMHSGGHLVALGLGLGMLFLLGMLVPAVIFIRGVCLIYLQAIQGLDFSGAEAQLQQALLEARRKAEAARQRAGEKIDEVRAKTEAQRAAAAKPDAASEPSGGLPSGPVIQPRHCSQCQALLAEDDIFCGECGTRNPR